MATDSCSRWTAGRTRRGSTWARSTGALRPGWLPPTPTAPPAYLPSGWMFWGRAGTLVAQRLDVAQATLTGEPVTVAEGVLGVSVAATGLVAHGNLEAMQRQLTWVDRSGTARGTVGDPDESISNPRLSPDGHRVVVERTVQRQHGPVAAGPRPHDQVHVRCRSRSISYLVARWHAARVPLEPDGSR